jgi:hypothetical protein
MQIGNSGREKTAFGDSSENENAKNESEYTLQNFMLAEGKKEDRPGSKLDDNEKRMISLKSTIWSSTPAITNSPEKLQCW